ncbi:glycoside hydrolase family 10 protein [Labilibaculum sp.]|uniref:glycoside hydrolase family 10 protein n=1 Tax=Labilibaculum sp. TaxID=2060723 RepID=UPI00356B27D6
MSKKLIIAFSFILLAVGAMARKYSHKREMRAVWVATVDNIDWPSKTGLSIERQKQEMIDLLNQHKKNGMNAIVFQIRPATDAFYQSDYEPWSQWLSGEQGVAPEPFYDPLQFAIEECHKRAMELHAWMNPYRAVFLYEKTKTDPLHISNQHPEWFLNYGKHKYFDPGFQETRDYVSKIVGDVVRRYDVDAIHFDDYFYPYKISGQPFPDSLSFAENGGVFFPDRIDDWRRDNVNQVIKQIHDTIKSIKPWLPFGISPFGVWRNKSVDKSGSRTEAGQTNYDDLYADILLWLQNDWIDYVAPQIYWHIGKKVANYRRLVKWWQKNRFGKDCYIGQGVYRLHSNSKVQAWQNSEQITRQIKLNRRKKGINGSMFFSSKNFLNNRLAINELLQSEVYKTPALIPVNKKFTGPIALAPKLELKNDTLLWKPVDGANYYIVYKHFGRRNAELEVFCITSCEFMPLLGNQKGMVYSVKSVNRGRRESLSSNVLEIGL